MMNRFRLSWLVLAPLAVWTCGGPSAPASSVGDSSPSGTVPHTSKPATPQDTIPPPPPPPPAARRDSLILRPGEIVVVGNTNLALKFLDVPEDSRCATGVQCVWEGNGAVRLELGTTIGPGGTVRLNSAIEPRHVEFQGYTIRLLFLEPYPVYEHPTTPSQYRAHVLVEAT